MITKDNFKEVLLHLEFEKQENIFVKHFGNFGAALKVDFDKQELIYPEDKGLTVNNRQTCNFSDSENLVVFECVYRLLEKGYQPQHIELEPKWKVGHGASGGRADILINDNSGKSLLIIECKTPGNEFNSAWRKAQNGVSQLLTYAQQQRSTKYLCLYASDFVGNKLTYDNYILTLQDNEKLLEEKKDLKPLTYKDAQEVEDLFKVWKETYALDYATKGIFENDIQPYEIGKNKYTIADLDSVSSDQDIQKKYHEFATILRQHNVSGRENAFDKLVNLFLCKIVDESRNSSDLKFYWKGIAYDSPFDLQDRLQKLYKDGMNEFLGEDVTYIDEKTIKNAFHFVKSKPDATQKKILEYFRELKFFTNNDFAFLDVHNENLFHQNFEVLLKIVKMLQDLRLQSENQNQFLGDMFEGFLDQGVKQSEGQYFTPSPITKFIIMSLPLESMIENGEKPPRAIDYACGAGHFLNELALQIKPFVAKHDKGDIKEFYKQIYGIEKEYRLSKVAKVSAFMYGQDEIHIIYGDALAQLEKNKHKAAAEIKNDSFDVLVANPPYSVKGFLETLSETERAQYSLLESIEEKSFASNNAIETFFVERAKQLLKPGGVAGIIAPSSILNKGNQKYPKNKPSNYVATREILLKYFDIIGIVELGSQTFGKTGTNTVVLFLRRKDNNPAPAEHYENRVSQWFDNDENQSVFEDEHFIKSYCAHIEIGFEDYKTLLNGKPNAALLEAEIFQDYRREFDNLTSTKNLKKQKYFQEKTEAEQKVQLDKEFLEYIQQIEKDKLLYFTLAADNSQKVVIVKSPATGKEQKEFLGYEWSNAKGNEGIKYFADNSAPAPATEQTEEEEADAEAKRLIENQNNLSRIKTALYDPNDRDNLAKINTYIQRNFNGEDFEVPESLAGVLSTARLVDMLDFSRTEFNKAFSLTPQRNTTIETKWDLASLDSVTEIKNGATPDTNNPVYWDNGTICWATLVDTKTKYLFDTERKITQQGLDGCSAVLLPVNTVIFSSRATIGEVCISKVPLATNQGYKNFICNEKLIRHEYLYYILVALRDTLENLVPSGTKYKEINTETIKNFKIPLPPKDVQTKIVAECEAVDAEVEKAKTTIADAEKTITEKVADVYQSNFDLKEIDAISLDVQYGINEAMNESGNGFKIFRMNEIIKGKLNDNGKMKYADIPADEFAKYKLSSGDILFNRTNSIEHVGKTGIFLLEGDYCFASYLIRVVVNRKLADPRFVNFMMNSQNFQQEAKSQAAKSINQANINATKMRNIKIPVPSLAQQEKLVQEIEGLEAEIRTAQSVVDDAAARKQVIMKRYL